MDLSVDLYCGAKLASFSSHMSIKLRLECLFMDLLFGTIF